MALTVLDGSTFCVCDERGDVDGIATASGFFASDTRFLSRSVLTLDGVRPDPLSHAQPAPHLAAFVMRNPPVAGLEPNELSVERERFVGDCMEERIAVRNHSQRKIEVPLGLELAADFADIFVVKSLEPGFGTPAEVELPPPRPLERDSEGAIVFADAAYPAGPIVCELSGSNSRTFRSGTENVSVVPICSLGSTGSFAMTSLSSNRRCASCSSPRYSTTSTSAS